MTLDGKDPLPKVAAAASTVRVGALVVGGGALTFAYGPCAVENEADLRLIARAAKQAGAQLLRGGAFKPRTSPYAFAGLGVEGLKLLRKIADEEKLAVVSEAMSEIDLPEVAAYCEVVQIGARSMACFPLLKAAAKCGRPALLKRGFGATVEEWLSAAEYILDGGGQVILCERGIRTFETGTRATLDVGGLALAKLRTRLPILADPSHAAGTPALVQPLALAAIAAGADGLLVEAHADPARARCDGPQALALDDLLPLTEAAKQVRDAVCCANEWPKTRLRPLSSASPR